MKKSMVFSAVIAVIGLAVYSSFLLTVKADTPNLIEDPGFETSMSNFEPNQSGTSVSITTVNPISGTRSLVVGTAGYGDSVLWNGVDMSSFATKRYSQFTSSARIRTTVASASNISLCALVYYVNGQGLNNCTEVSGSVGDKGTVALNFPLNNSLDLDTVRIGIFQEGSAPLSGVLLDDVSVVLVGNSSTTTPQTFTVTSTAGTGGTISPVGATSVSSGASQTFSISPNSGYQISQVLVDGISQGAVPSYTFTNVTANHTISASFSVIPPSDFTITSAAGTGGTISPSGAVVVASGASQTFNISSNSGYQLSDVLVDGISQGVISSFTFTNVTANHTISASFSEIPPTSHSITASAGANGSISPVGTVVVTNGASQTFNITPNSGYQINDVLVDGVSQGVVSSYVFTNVVANHTISASFSQIPQVMYSISASASAGGTISPNGSVSVLSGASQTFNITPNSGYQINSVLVDGLSVGPISSYTFFNVTANHTISASFSSSQTSTPGVSGLVTQLKFDNDATDSVGGNDFTLRGTASFNNSITAPITGNVASLFLDGGVESQALGGSSLFSGWTGGTVAFWMRIDSATAQTWANSSNHDLLFKDGVLQTRVFKDANGQLKLMTIHSDGTSFGTGTWITSSNSIPTDSWLHVVLVHGGTTASIYFNGQFAGSGNVGKTLGVTNSNILEISTYDGRFAGYLDDVRFYNRAITEAEALQLASENGTPVQTFSIVASSGTGGSISPSGVISVASGASQTFSITPNSGYQINGLSVDGVSQGAVSSYTFTNVTANHTISASFSEIPPTSHSITASAGANGSISPSGSVIVASGANQTFNIAANSGYQILDVLVDGASAGVISTYTFSNVTTNHTISASFSQIPQSTYTISASAGTGGSISPNSTVVVTAGGSQTFNITTNAGYQISNVLVDGSSVGAVASYTFTNVNTNHTISVAFAVAPSPEGTFQINNQYITGLQNPTAMAFAPDGRLFVTEQAGAVRVITAEGQLLSTPFLVTTNMRSDEERGLLGIAFDPNFATNNYIYIFYTENSLGSRLSRFTANGNVVVPGSELILLEYYNISGNHRGGDIHFGPDGKLYLSLGDAGEPLNSQTVDNYNGKILRLNSDGTIPSDNPASFVNTSGQTLTPVGQYRAIWAFGLRNPYRFSFNSVTGLMHINDVGAGLWEEVNVGNAGINYGWPTCEGLCSNTYARNPIYIHERGIEGCAITGGAFYTGNQFPAEYYNNYFIIDYCSTWVRYLNTSNASATFVLPVPEFSVDLKTAPDGSLLVAGHGSGIISKITFVASSTNRNPVAVMSVNPTSGPSPLVVNFDGSGSSDLDNDALSYLWDFGDGNTGSGVTTVHTYNVGGAYTSRLTVSDGNGGTHSVTTGVMVGAPPVATIDIPAEGLLYTAGDTINFAGTATDPDDGVLPASAYSWTVVFHHDAHTHPHLGPVVGVTSGSFSVPTFGHTEESVWFRINLTVTDSNGLQTTVSRDVLPRKAIITIDSNIPGTEILLDGSPQTTPYSFVGVVGVERTIGVTTPQTLGGQGYEFNSWSDGGAVSHVVATPSTNTTYAVNMVVQTTPTLPNPSLYWKFNKNLIESILGVTTVGRGTIVYSTSSAPITAINTSSISFNGAAGTYIATNGTQILNAWPAATVSKWVRITSATANSWTNNSYHALLFKYRVLQTRIKKESTGLKFVATHSNNTPFGTHIVSTINIPTDTWVNLVSVHQGTNVTLYINGQFAGSGSTGKAFGAASTDGLDIIGHGGNYSGLLDDLRMYNTAFTEAQVQQIPLQ